jgi:pyruvate/2-oxoglutarate dehydrogenase complex dihydrolipoamide acyltransferase (E2) component
MTAKDLPTLIWEARKRVAYSNRDFAALTGMSLRTVERMSASGSYRGDVATLLAKKVFPVDPALARDLAVALGTTTIALGLEEPPAPPTPPAKPAPVAPAVPAKTPARQEHADSVVLAAANAMQVLPNAVLPAVVAAMRRAAEMDVDLNDLVRLLSKSPKASP